METETNRTAEPPATRAVGTEFSAGLNRPVADRSERGEPAATPADEVGRTVADGDRSARSYTGVDAVVENVATPARELAARLQALRERFAEADGPIRRCRTSVDTARERRVSGPY